jgi:hypothetical protein
MTRVRNDWIKKKKKLLIFFFFFSLRKMNCRGGWVFDFNEKRNKKKKEEKEICH